MSLILASQSASRRAMLEAAGVTFTARPATLDERSVEAGLHGASAEEVALELAKAKALAVSREVAGQWVLGSDSLVTVAGERFDKPHSRQEAADHLAFFSGKGMELTSAAALAQGGRVVWEHVETARLKVRELSSGFIAHYLDREWPAVAGCVGVFRIEALGANLFETIDGSHFTVLGMPLLPVLGALRQIGEIKA